MIAKLTPDNVASYRQLRLLALQTDPDAYFAIYDQVAHYSESYFHSELVSSPDSVFGYYGYFDADGTLLAYCYVQESYFLKTKHSVELLNLYVHPSVRNQGIASTLLSEVIKKIRNKKTIEIIFLTVIKGNNKAISLYTKLGFVSYAVKERSLKYHDRYFDEVFMRLDF